MEWGDVAAENTSLCAHCLQGNPSQEQCCWLDSEWGALCEANLFHLGQKTLWGLQHKVGSKPRAKTVKEEMTLYSNDLGRFNLSDGCVKCLLLFCKLPGTMQDGVVSTSP